MDIVNTVMAFAKHYTYSLPKKLTNAVRDQGIWHRHSKYDTQLLISKFMNTVRKTVISCDVHVHGFLGNLQDLSVLL